MACLRLSYYHPALHSSVYRIILTSNDGLVASWTIQPAVFLTILSSILQVTLSGALASSIAIRFHLCASHGTILSQLHHIWDRQGIRIFAALRSGSAARKVAVVTAFVYRPH